MLGTLRGLGATFFVRLMGSPVDMWRWGGLPQTDPLALRLQSALVSIMKQLELGLVRLPATNCYKRAL